MLLAHFIDLFCGIRPLYFLFWVSHFASLLSFILMIKTTLFKDMFSSWKDKLIFQVDELKQQRLQKVLKLTRVYHVSGPIPLTSLTWQWVQWTVDCTSLTIWTEGLFRWKRWDQSVTSRRTLMLLLAQERSVPRGRGISVGMGNLPWLLGSYTQKVLPDFSGCKTKFFPSKAIPKI